MARAIPWLVLLTLAALPRPGASAGPQEPIPDLSGRFKLNARESDDARRKMREERGRPGERRPGGGAPLDPDGDGSGIGGGHPADLDGGREPDETMRAVFEPPEEITITQSAMEVEVAALYGDLRVFRPNGKKLKAENGTVVRVAAWKDGTLIVETKNRAGQRIRETWSISPESRRLTVDVKVEGRFGPKLTLRRVYDPVAAPEP